MRNPLKSFLAIFMLFFNLFAQNAEIVSISVPGSVKTDEVFHVEIEMRNTGGIPWGAGSENTGATLVSKFPDFNTTWGTYFITMHQGNTIPTNETYLFESYLMAPSIPGVYQFAWQCQNWLPEGGAIDTTTSFFGQTISNVYITVIQRTETAPPSPVPSAEMLDSSDFEYMGSFKLPSLPGYEQTYTNSGLSLKNTDGKNNLLIITGTYDFALYEAEIPELVKPVNGEMSELNTATVVTNWGPLDFGNIGGENIQPNSGYWYDNDSDILYWTHYNSYFTGGGSDFPVLMSTKLNTDGTKENLNYWYLPDVDEPFKSYWGGIIELSDNFANTYTDGRKFALGFGGYFSICGTASRGPAIGAIRKPDPADSSLDLLPMMTYPDPVACPREGNYFSNIGYWSTQPTAPWEGWWTGIDACRAGVFIDLPDKKGYMVFAKQGIGRLGYDFGGYNADGKYQQCWYFYSINDLGAAALEAVSPDEIIPVKYYSIKYPVEGGIVSGACFDKESRMLYIYSRKPVIHVYHLKETAASTHNTREKFGFKLEQNYPNPFNPTTTIKYSLPTGGANNYSPVQLKIYNLLGQEVATLVNENQQAANYEVEFDASGLGSGVYFYRLSTGEFQAVRKLIILK